MLYTLSNGRTIDISVELYLDMTDEELHGLNALNIGMDSISPFHNSVLKKGEISTSLPAYLEDAEEDYFEEREPDITELMSEEKLVELDLELQSDES